MMMIFAKRGLVAPGLADITISILKQLLRK